MATIRLPIELVVPYYMLCLAMLAACVCVPAAFCVCVCSLLHRAFGLHVCLAVHLPPNH
jgi:hypothetical protein